MSRTIRIEDLRAGVLMKPQPFTALKGTADEFTVELKPLSGENRTALLATSGGQTIQRMACAFATGLSEEEADKVLPVPAIVEIGAEALTRAGLFLREEMPAPKATPPESPAEPTPAN